MDVEKKTLSSHMPKRLILSSILKFSNLFLEVSMVPSKTRGGGVVKILRKVGVPSFFSNLCFINSVSRRLRIVRKFAQIGVFPASKWRSKWRSGALGWV